MRVLFGILPPRVYPIIDVLGQDAYRELDSYVTYDLVGLDRIAEAACLYADFLFEDGMVGFGAMAEDPFAYVFLDEHKVVTIRAGVDLKERIERVLEAFDLREASDLRAVDSVAHEHRSVLAQTPADARMMLAEEILERLRDEWGLLLNIDAESNVDDEGRELGLTWWRCLVRCHRAEADVRYAEILLAAHNLLEAERLAIDATSQGPNVPKSGWVDQVVVFHDRLAGARLREILDATPSGAPIPPTTQKPTEPGIIRALWIE